MSDDTKLINLCLHYSEYPLKSTIPLPLDVIFQQYITQTYGGDTVWQPVSKVFTDISQLRGELIFEQYNAPRTADVDGAQKVIDKLLLYYRYLLFLQEKFRFEYYQQGSIKIPFQWSNSFNAQKSIASPSLIFEKSCILYNLAVLYNAQGVCLMNGKTMNERKISTQKFRFGLWCVQSIRELTMNIPQDLKIIHSDLGENNLDILYHSMLGNCYAALYSNLLQDEMKIKVNNIASLAGEASYNFTIALSKANALIQAADSFIPSDHLLKIKANLFFGSVRFSSIAGIKMAKWHQGEQEDDIKGGHIGWALGYIKNALSSLQKAFANEGVMKVLEKDQKAELEALKKEVETQFAQLNQRNEQIYKHVVPEDKKLPRTQLMSQLVIQPFEPKELSVKIQIDNQMFANFANEDTINLILEIKGFAQQKSQEVESAQKQILDMKNTAYLENFVNFFLDMVNKNGQSSKSQTLPPKVADKISKINQLGGTQKLLQNVQNLKDSNLQCGLILQNIRKTIMTEQQEDESMKQQYNFKWTRAPSSQTNKDYLGELKNLDDNFKIACDIEMENQSKWSSNQSVVEILSKPQQEQLKILGANSAEDDFKAQNQQQLQQLEQVDIEINQFLTSIKECVNQINNTIRNYNYQEEVTKSLQNKVPKEKILESILAPVSQQTNNLNNIIANFSTKVSEACSISIDLQQRRNQKSGGGSMEQQEKISGGLAILVGLFDDCAQGMKFYQDLTGLALDLQKKVEDFVQARDMEKNNLLQMINNELQKNNFQQAGGFGQFPGFNQPPQQPYGGNNFYQQQPQQQQQPFNPYAPNPYAQQQYFQQPPQQGQFPPQNSQNPPQSQPFYNNGQFNAGQSVFMPHK